nr:MAG TPA: hypothetical protein [Crassvirales sp.]
MSPGIKISQPLSLEGLAMVLQFCLIQPYADSLIP